MGEKDKGGPMTALDTPPLADLLAALRRRLGLYRRGERSSRRSAAAYASLPLCGPWADAALRRAEHFARRAARVWEALRRFGGAGAA